MRSIAHEPHEAWSQTRGGVTSFVGGTCAVVVEVVDLSPSEAAAIRRGAAARVFGFHFAFMFFDADGALTPWSVSQAFASFFGVKSTDHISHFGHAIPILWPDGPIIKRSTQWAGE